MNEINDKEKNYHFFFNKKNKINLNEENYAVSKFKSGTH